MTQGIYQILGPGGRCYVGQSTNVESRLREHFSLLRRGAHNNLHLERAWAKYGEEAFSARILEVVEDSALLTPREQYWIEHFDAFRNGYNRAAIAGVPPSQKGVAKTKEHRQKIAQAHTGKVFTEAHRAAISAAKKGVPTPKHSDEVKAAIAAWNKGRKHSPETIEKIRASKQNMSAETRARMSKPRSEQAKANMRAAWVKRRLAANTAAPTDA